MAIIWKDRAEKYRAEKNKAMQQLKQFRRTLKGLRKKVMVFRTRTSNLEGANANLKRNNDHYRRLLNEVKLAVTEREFEELARQADGIFAA